MSTTNALGNAPLLPVSSFVTPEGLMDLAFSAEDLRVLNYSFWTDGVVERRAEQGTAEVAWVNGLNVSVAPGRVHIDGTVAFFQQKQLTLERAATAPRIDSVIVQRDLLLRTCNIMVKSGTPADLPVPPALQYNFDGLCEFPLADVYVAAGVSQISAGDIQDRRVFMRMNLGGESSLLSFPLGWQALVPYPAHELPLSAPGWYFCNGDRYLNTGKVAAQLNKLSSTYRNAWGITNNGTSTNVPKFFHVDGRGYFVRAVDGSTRLVGSAEFDQLQDHWHRLYRRSYLYGGGVASSGSGVDSHHGDFATGTDMDQYVRQAIPGTVDARIGTETRGINIGMTPAIYLGV